MISTHQSGWMWIIHHNKISILDMKVWVETREKEHNREVKRVTVILHEFFGKSMASKAVANARYVLPWTVKRTVLTQEVLRVMLRYDVVGCDHGRLLSNKSRILCCECGFLDTPKSLGMRLLIQLLKPIEQ